MIFFYIVILVFVCYRFFKFTSKYRNPYKLIMVFGKKGSGKTTLLTKLAIKYHKQGRTVYSTVQIPSTRRFDVSKLGDYTFDANSVVFIDEVGMIWDNREFKNFRNEVRDWFKLQRQSKVTVYLFSQSFDIDKKLRDLTDEMYLLSIKFNVLSVAKRISKKVTIIKGADGTSRLDEEYAFVPFIIPGSRIYTWVPRWIPFFKSFDPKKLPYIEYGDILLTPLQERYLSTLKYLSDIYVYKVINSIYSLTKRLRLYSLAAKILSFKDRLRRRHTSPKTTEVKQQNKKSPNLRKRRRSGGSR